MTSAAVPDRAARDGGSRRIIVMMGAPGAGKGTQAERLAEALGLPHVSTGELFRAMRKSDTPLAEQVRGFMDSGALVPDDIVVAMVDDRLTWKDAAEGVILDGFPRTVAQAEALDAMLDKAGRKLDHVLQLDVPDEVLVERITGRRSDPETGRVYHVKFNPPPAEVADRCIQRSDDTEEVLKKRLDEYHAKTAPLIPYYDKAGLLRKIAGQGTPDEIKARVADVLG